MCPGISVLCCSEAMRPGSPVGSFKPQAVVSVSADPPGDLSVLPVHSGPACSLGSGWLTPRISGQSLRDRQPECIRNFKGHFPKPLPLCNLPGVLPSCPGLPSAVLQPGTWGFSCPGPLSTSCDYIPGWDQTVGGKRTQVPGFGVWRLLLPQAWLGLGLGHGDLPALLGWYQAGVPQDTGIHNAVALQILASVPSPPVVICQRPALSRLRSHRPWQRQRGMSSLTLPGPRTGCPHILKHVSSSCLWETEEG